MKMSHPDPCYDPDNSHEDDMYDIDANYDDHNDFYEDMDDYQSSNEYWETDYDDSMDGDHDSAMNSIGWDVDEGYGCYDSYGEDF
jgi:hypothetical protein